MSVLGHQLTTNDLSGHVSIGAGPDHTLEFIHLT